MTEKKWAIAGFAAVIILAAGAFVALAEEEMVWVNVEVEAEGDDQTAVVEVKSGESVDVFTVDDLEDGEERVFQSGDRTVTVRRTGDEIDVLLDGEELAGGGKRIEKIIKVEGGGDANVWHVKEGGEGVKVIKIKKGEGGEELVWHGEDGDVDLQTIIADLDCEAADGEECDIELIVEKLGGHHGAVFIGADGEVATPKIIKMMGHPHSDMVHYRCESTGSVLMVKKENATYDSFIDPATGCEMNKVEVKDEHVMVIKKKVQVVDEEE